MSQTPKVRSIQRKLEERERTIAALRPEHSRLLARIDVLEKGEGIADAEARVRNAEKALSDAEERLEAAEAGRRNAERSTVAYLALLLERSVAEWGGVDVPGETVSFRFTREDLFRALPLGARVRFEEDGDAIVVRLAPEGEAPAADGQALAAQAVLAPVVEEKVSPRIVLVGDVTHGGDPETCTGCEAPVVFQDEAPAGQRFGAGRIALGEDEDDEPVAPV